MDSHAHLTLPFDQASISPLLRGAYIVGHSEDLSCTEVIVRPAVRGTASVYGSDKLRSSGNGGRGDDELHSRTEFAPPLFRTRLR